MDVLRIAAFSQGNQGGNPAGVLISEKLPSAEEMQKIAKDVGFSETAFAMPEAGNWRVRYFAPETEIPSAAMPRLHWVQRSPCARVTDAFP